MSLDTTISLTTVSEFLSSARIDYPQRNALWIYYDGANATATVEVQDSKIVLTDSGATDVVFATYDTLTKVVDQINTVTGWHAGLIYIGTLASNDLIITGSLNAKGTDNEQTLKIKDTHLIEQLINRASDFLNRHCSRMLKTTTYTLKRHSGEGTKLILDDYPVTEIMQICDGTLSAIKIKHTSSTAYNAYARVTKTGVILSVGGTPEAELLFATYKTLTTMAVAIAAKTGWEASVYHTDYGGWPSTLLFEKQNVYALNQYSYIEVPGEPLYGYEEDLENGIIYLPSEFSEGFKNIFVSCKAGYVTIPPMLEQICIELVKYKYDKAKKDSSIKSEKIGMVYSYTLQDLKEALPSSMMAELDLFTKRDL